MRGRATGLAFGKARGANTRTWPSGSHYATCCQARGRRIVELGASFGRLADLYTGYDQVILLDYAKSGLREAQERLGRSDRYIYVAADIYHLPLAPGACDTAVTVRVLHHLADIPAALRGIARGAAAGRRLRGRVRQQTQPEGRSPAMPRGGRNGRRTIHSPMSSPA